MNNKKRESVKNKNKKNKKKDWVEQGKFLKEQLIENHGGRLGCSVKILVSLKEHACSVEKKVF